MNDNGKVSLRIVHVIDNLNAGGRERQLVELIKGIESTSIFQSAIFVLSKSTIHYADVFGTKVAIRFFERKAKKDPLILWSLYKELKNMRPHIVHTWSSMSSVYLLPLSKILGIKTVNGMIRGAKRHLKFPDERWIRSKITFPFSDRIVTNSKAGMKCFNTPLKKSRYIYNGFDFKRIINLPSKSFLKRKFGLETTFVVGMVASFSKYKDYDTYISAAIKLSCSDLDITFVTIGSGSMIESYKEKVANSGLSNKILFLGARNDVESIVKTFDIGVLCTNTKHGEEGISNVIMEYMALKKPVIATNCGGNCELVQHGVTGYLIEEFTSDELVRIICELLDNIEDSKKMGMMGREIIEEKFSINKMLDKYCDLYLSFN